MTIQLNLLEAIEARNEGMTRAITHADAVSENWSGEAYRFLQRYLKNMEGVEFMAEDVRSFAALVDFPLPPSARAWGGVINKAANNGLIRKVGHGTVKNVKAHRCFASVWIKNNAA